MPKGVNRTWVGLGAGQVRTYGQLPCEASDRSAEQKPRHGGLSMGGREQWLNHRDSLPTPLPLKLLVLSGERHPFSGACHDEATFVRLPNFVETGPLPLHCRMP